MVGTAHRIAFETKYAQDQGLGVGFSSMSLTDHLYSNARLLSTTNMRRFPDAETILIYDFGFTSGPAPSLQPRIA